MLCDVPRLTAPNRGLRRYSCFDLVRDVERRCGCGCRSHVTWSYRTVPRPSVAHCSSANACPAMPVMYLASSQRYRHMYNQPLGKIRVGRESDKASSARTNGCIINRAVKCHTQGAIPWVVLLHVEQDCSIQRTSRVQEVSVVVLVSANDVSMSSLISVDSYPRSPTEPTHTPSHARVSEGVE